MKISCNEGILTALATRGCFSKEGRLNYRKETKKSYKERWFKLRANLLFYYKTNDFGIICEDEPRGCLILARYTLKEEFVANALFAFSITFHGSNEKHYFVGQSTDHCKGWIKALQNADMDILRQKILNLRVQLRQINPLFKANEIAPPIFKKSNKPLANIPKRLEKKFIVGDDKTRKETLQPSMEWHIPKVKSSSALEQVRKSYSLASLMLDPLKSKLRDDPSGNKSTFFVDRKNFFTNTDHSEVFSYSLDAFVSKRKSSVDPSLIASHIPYPSSEPALIDMSDKEPEQKPSDESTILRNKPPRHLDATIRHSCIFKPADIPALREHSNQYGIVLRPLALVSDPFVSSFTKPIGPSKRDCCFVKQESEDCFTNHGSAPFENDFVYRRPRSCTLAQLESIPSHLQGCFTEKDVVFSIGDEVLGEAFKKGDRKGFQNWETFED